MLGDIFLAFETLQAEAKQQEKTFENHCYHLFVHGFLHLLGYDHEVDHDAEIMEQAETIILGEFSISNPYNTMATL